MHKISDRAKRNKPDIESIDKALKRLEEGQNRLLDAYRANIITMSQLKDQMAKIQDRKIGLEQEKNSNAEEYAMPTKRSINGYCKKIAKHLDGLDFDGRRFVVTKLVNTIRLDNKRAVIKGVLGPFVSQPLGLFYLPQS